MQRSPPSPHDPPASIPNSKLMPPTPIRALFMRGTRVSNPLRANYLATWYRTAPSPQPPSISSYFSFGLLSRAFTPHWSTLVHLYPYLCVSICIYVYMGVGGFLYKYICAYIGLYGYRNIRTHATHARFRAVYSIYTFISPSVRVMYCQSRDARAGARIRISFPLSRGPFVTRTKFDDLFSMTI